MHQNFQNLEKLELLKQYRDIEINTEAVLEKLPEKQRQ